MNLKHIILMLAAGVLAACTQDELNSSTEKVEGSLPEGRYPLVLTARMGTSTRATVDNTWDVGTTVYVQIVDNYTEGQTYTWSEPIACTVAANGELTFPTGETPYWIKNTEHKLIRAWWRGDNSSSLESNFSVSNNQSQAYPTNTYDASDFVFAQDEITFEDDGNGASLTFYHQVAKVILNIKNDNISASEYLTAVYLSTNTYYQGAYTPPVDVKSDYGNWSSNPSWCSQIVMRSRSSSTEEYKGSYEAIVIPQTKSGGDDVFYIQISDYQLDNFVYKAPNDFTWKPGYVYTYDVTVKPTGLEVETNENIDNWDAGSSGSGSVEI